MLHLLLDYNVVSMSGVSTSVSSTLGYLLLFHPILEYPILRPPLARLGLLEIRLKHILNTQAEEVHVQSGNFPLNPLLCCHRRI